MSRKSRAGGAPGFPPPNTDAVPPPIAADPWSVSSAAPPPCRRAIRSEAWSWMVGESRTMLSGWSVILLLPHSITMRFSLDRCMASTHPTL